MAYGKRVRFEAIREAAFGDVGAAYAALGSALSNAARIIAITNTCNAEVYISFNGTDNHLRLAANSFKLLDFGSNKVRDDGFFLSEGTVIYQKRVAGAPGSGAVWAEVIYALGGQ